MKDPLTYPPVIDGMTAQRVTRATATARDAVLTALIEVQSAEASVDPKTLLPSLLAANDAAQAAVQVLHHAGHTAPDSFPVPRIPPHLCDTPDTRELLALLEKAQAVAERIDAARGRALSPDIPLLPGESHGRDLAETISTIAVRVRGEVKGPNAVGQE